MLGSSGHTRLRIAAICWGDHFQPSKLITVLHSTSWASSLGLGRERMRRVWLIDCAEALA